MSYTYFIKRIPVVLMLLVFIAACGGGGIGMGDEATPEEPDSPTVIDVISSATSGGRGISITFPNAMDTASVESLFSMSIDGPVLASASASKDVWEAANLSFLWSNGDKTVRIYVPMPYCSTAHFTIPAESLDVDGYELGQGIEGDVEIPHGDRDIDWSAACTDDLMISDASAKLYFLITGEQIVGELAGMNSMGDLIEDPNYVQIPYDNHYQKPLKILGNVSDGGAVFGSLCGGKTKICLYQVPAEMRNVTLGTDLDEIVNIANMEDMNGDGFTDMVMTALSYDDKQEIESYDYYLIYGRESFSSYGEFPATDADLYAGTFSLTYDQQKGMVSCGQAKGDFNGDGLADYASCLDYNAVQSITIVEPSVSDGVVTLPSTFFSGGSTIQNLVGSIDWYYSIASSKVNSAPMARLDAGDVNGDGVDDLVMGNWNMDAFALFKVGDTSNIDTADFGIFVVLNSHDDPSFRKLPPSESVPSASPIKIKGGLDASNSSHFHMLSPYIVGDWNADGMKDIVAMDTVFDWENGKVAHYQLMGFRGRESWEELTVADADFVLSFPAEGTIAKIAHAAGDVNNDGYDDIRVSYSHKDADTYEAILLGGTDLSGGVALDASAFSTVLQYYVVPK